MSALIKEVQKAEKIIENLATELKQKPNSVMSERPSQSAATVSHA